MVTQVAQKFRDAFDQFSTSTIDKVVELVKREQSAGVSNTLIAQHANDLIGLEYDKLTPEYKESILDVFEHTRSTFPNKRDLDPDTRSVVHPNRDSNAIDASPTLPHIRHQDGGPIRPNPSSGRPAKAGQSLLTAQDLDRAGNESEFKKDLRARLAARYTPRPSRPAPKPEMPR